MALRLLSILRPAHTSSNLPLFEKPPIHTVQLPRLIEWRNWARQQALNIGSKYKNLDNGPQSDELLREIDWYLEDTVAEIDYSGECKKFNTSIFQRSDLGHDWLVRLRASIEDLEKGWKERVEERRPFQYVVGCAHWRDLVLSVEEGVLIPRPETEQMIDLASEAMASNESLRKGIWADLGTGSGAIALGIAHLLEEQGSVLAVDDSAIATAVACFNIERYHLQEKVKVLKGSWFAPIQHLKGQLSGLLSNPPYIPSGDISGLQAEVGRHEPVRALDGGPAGTDCLIHICDNSTLALCSGGFLALETNGGNQAYAIADYLSKIQGPCFHNVNVVKDFSEIPRFVTALRC